MSDRKCQRIKFKHANIRMLNVRVSSIKYPFTGSSKQCPKVVHQKERYLASSVSRDIFSSHSHKENMAALYSSDENTHCSNIKNIESIARLASKAVMLKLPLNKL